MVVRGIRNNRSGVQLGVFLLILLIAPAAVCETIYRWENEAGEAFYSNISPPEKESRYQIITMGREEGHEGLSTAGPSAGLHAIETPAATDRSFPVSPAPSLKCVLNERIKSRKNEIGAMEQLLRKSSDDGLRRSLMRKKRYLAEELIYWAELNP